MDRGQDRDSGNQGGQPPKLHVLDFMELTTKQAIYSLLVPSLLMGTPFFKYRTIKIIQEGLMKVYGIDVTREHTNKLVREIEIECDLVECEKEKRQYRDIYLPRERVFRLQSPGNILTARKWKRDGNHRPEAFGKVKKKTNPA